MWLLDGCRIGGLGTPVSSQVCFEAERIALEARSGFVGSGEQGCG